MTKTADNYDAILEVVRSWPAKRRYSLVHDVLKTLEPEDRQERGEDTLSLALGLLATDGPSPTDEEIKKWLEEHRIEKYE